ncbi:MAG: DNA polymerase III, subunit gamma and tau [Coxiella sp. RIFCSPHIGHO2_12_FULL_42_15]|nr:MAG: DNA polymerase III, subunit gamma and tau [Coxiella sp. RIFCSPHIGHO2_12_FULL_42_15]
MPYQVLARKYRPTQFQEVVGQAHVVQALTNALNQGLLHHAYLFTGTRGVGKTTLARIFAKCLSCETGITAQPCDQCSHCREIDKGRFPDFFEIDAASRTKVEDTRELLDNVQYAPAKGRLKIYLIDEVHMLSGHSFNALLKTLEEPPAHVKFLLATTDHQKLPATVLSRCLQFHLQQTTPEQAASHLTTILQKENIAFDRTALQLIGKAANGSMRDGLSILDQSIAFGDGKVLEPDVKSLLGTIEASILIDILNALQKKNGTLLLANIAKLQQQGADFARALAELLSLLHNISVLQIVPDISLEDHDPALPSLAAAFSAEDIQLFYQIGIMGQRDFAFAPSPKIAFEMTLLRMLAFYPEKLALSATKPTIATTQSQKEKTWPDIVAKLSLTGAALVLAQNCTLENLTDTKAHLLIKSSQKALAQPNQIQRLQQALSDYLQRPMRIAIKFGDQEQQTPAELTQQQHEQRQQAAKRQFAQDPKIQQLMQAFDATLIEESITTDKNHLEQ